MKKIVLISFLFFGCKTLEYPIVTRYKEPKVKYVRVHEPKKVEVPNITRFWEIALFVTGTLVLYRYIERAK